MEDEKVEQEVGKVGRELATPPAEMETNSTLSAGRELDALVAERVMGREVLYQSGNISRTANDDGQHAEMWVGRPTTLERCQKDCSEWNTGMRLRLKPMPKGNPRYSTDIAAAMQVVEKLRGQSLAVSIMDTDAGAGGNWSVTFDSPVRGFEAECLSLPEAICRAALQAVTGNSVR